MNTMAQDIQDEIFRNMTAEQKLEVWAGLWRLAKDLTEDSIKDKKFYESNRSKNTSQKHC